MTFLYILILVNIALTVWTLMAVNETDKTNHQLSNMIAKVLEELTAEIEERFNKLEQEK